MVKSEFIKYPGIPYLETDLSILENPVQVFEKLDGGNCQVRKINGRIIPGSRSNFLEGSVVERIPWFKDFVSWADTNEDFYSLDENFVLFGEWLSFHNIRYADENMNTFYFIDMYDIEEESFIPYEEALDYLRMMGINLNELGVLREGRVSRGELEEVLRQKSDYREGIKEGIVIKDYERGRFVKKLHPKFSEKVEGDRNLPDDKKYVTYNRWRKTRDALLEEGRKLTLENVVSRMRLDIQKGHNTSLSKKRIYKRLKEMGVS